MRPANTCLPPRHPPDKAVPPPKLVSTFPSEGQTVAPGLLELRLTFDLPMACTGGVIIRGGRAEPCIDKAQLTQHWLQYWGRRTVRLLCRVEPGAHYVVRMNKAAPGEGNPWPPFVSLAGSKAGPYELSFATSKAEPVQTQAQADDEDPTMAAFIERGHDEVREP